tara:strand:+ start:714 stop:971 length:258 start_codon:yes stop_codon:yes gene_type:complete
MKLTTNSTPDTNPTTPKYILIEAPAEPLGAPSDPFSIPPSRSDGASTDITALHGAIVKQFNHYSIEVKVDAAREMMTRLKRRYDI